MKTKTSRSSGARRLPAALDFLPSSSLAILTERSSAHTGRNILRNAIRLAMAGTMLFSGMSYAQLRDHGPIRSTGTSTLPADFFPDWYRETAEAGGMAIGQCIFTDDAGNGPLCLTSTADATAGRFAGNVGPEAFFATADVTIPITGGSLLWMGHLEMAYNTADGEPPAVRNAADPQEIVFSRERIRIDLPTTDNGSCTGDYIVRTPYAVHNFTMEEGGRALFYTDDKTPIPGDYTAALKGHAGPFLKWDVGQDGVSPVSAANPAVTFTPPVGATRKYIGDPNIEHAFVGSTLPAGPGHQDKVFNNYVEIVPPAGCDLGAGAGNPLFNDLAAISGPIWDLPIQDPITITKATYVRNPGTAALDVWAETTKNQTIVLTASNDESQHLPSITMPEEIVGGSRTGRYHAHLEFDPAQPIPTAVTATNLTSNPVSRSSSGVSDAVVVTKSFYNPATKKLCITAHSGDATSPVPLRLDAPAYGGFATTGTATCPKVDSNDQVLEKDLNNFNPDKRIPPEGIIVQSNLGGSETSHPISLTGISDADVLSGAVSDVFDNIPGTGTTTLDLTAPAFGAAAPDLVKLTAGADTPPANFRIVVVSQPTNNLGEQLGTVTAPVNGGSVTYTAQEGMDASDLTFYYAIQDTTNLTVTNVARVDLSVDKTVPPPVGVADRQGVFRTSTGAILPVLANDTTGLGSTAIDPATIQIATVPGLGTATANADGTITYTPVGQSGTANNTIDSFTYTVANVAGARSNPITVQVALKTATEAVAFQRVRWTGSRWDIRFTSTYAGAAGAITLAPSAQCVMSNNGGAGVNGNIGGPVLPGAGTNSYVNVANSPAAVGSTWRVTCNTSSGGSASRTGTL